MKKILCLIFLFVFLLSGCKKEENVSSTVSSTENFVNQEIKSDDIQDPQNNELKNETGSQISADSLTQKQGKANGIDVSKWQGKINWQKVKKQGIDFAIIRVGYRGENGKIYKDEHADYNIQQADKAGILVGVYFFSTAINTAEAEEEANFTASLIESYSITYPVVYDCEGFNSYDSRMNSLTTAQRTQNAIAFLQKIESLGYEGMFYSSMKDLTLYWDTALIEKDFKIWIARYPSPTYPQILTPPDYTGKYDMWQYTNMGTVNGINGNTDMIVSYFTKEKAKPKSQNKVTEAKPPVEKDNIYTSQQDTVTAKDIVNLRESASTNSNIVGTLKNGETINRIAVGTNGWSKLDFGGKTVFAITSYLTTDLSFTPPVTKNPEDSIYTDVNETVTAKNETNLRDKATTSGSTVIYTLKNGETVTRTGVGSNGWSRLNYNGQTVYAISSYLTTELSYKPPVESTPEIELDNGMQFTEVNEQVTAKSETNLRTKPTTNGSEVVYTLKSGEFVTRTGTSSSGWSRLNYNGQTVYAISSYLTVLEN